MTEHTKISPEQHHELLLAEWKMMRAALVMLYHGHKAGGTNLQKLKAEAACFEALNTVMNNEKEFGSHG